MLLGMYSRSRLGRTKTATVTSTTGTPSTSVVFLPGNPPPSKERREADAVEGVAMEKRDMPDYLNGVASQAISSACECLNLATPVVTSTKTSTKTSTVNVPAATVTKTVYRTFFPSSLLFSWFLFSFSPNCSPCCKGTIVSSRLTGNHT